MSLHRARMLVERSEGHPDPSPTQSPV
uniref:Uncharacterized protein n=1 Tax=Anguilla anguilla TaxID=7936 RepID=A0A0E9SNZ4_ANGAN